ncbi:MAG TPA: hypothetical protein VES19_07660 [Candidatus Limnocylindrales bacterium]|nr:hypothetical protein [Candidatus Limnocylindrales bacterium]
MARKPVALPPVPTGEDRPLVLVRVYPGYHEDAARLLVADADTLAERGYALVGQSYAEGRYGQGLVLLAVVLVLAGIGIVMLAYMAAVRPPGSLAATFELRGGLPPVTA